MRFTTGGRYSIERRLGTGSFGVVYAALDNERKMRVALKALKERNPDTLLRFKNEFRALVGLRHHNLATLYELVADGEQWFFTMELVEGTDLLSHVWGRAGQGAGQGAQSPTDLPTGAYDSGSTPSEAALTDPLRGTVADTGGGGPYTLPMEQRGDAAPGTAPGLASASAPGPVRSLPTFDPRPAPTFDPRLLRAVLLQLVAGVEALHRAGKLHRDIKPSNVLVTPAGRVVLLDFGLVQELAPADGPELAVVGTPWYMSPEQARAEAVTPAADWYSVGVMLYEVLTGQRPHTGGRDQVLAVKQRSDPVPPGQLVEGLPPDLCQLCMELLCRTPAQRPTGSALLQRLRRGGAGAQTSGVELPAVTPTPRPPPGAEIFIGRVRELERLTEAFEAARDGTQVVLLQGPSGMGKTSLIQQFLSQAASEEPLSLQGRCYERETLPFKAVDSLMDALCVQLARMDQGELRRLLPPRIHALTRLFPAFAGLRAVERTPLPEREVPDRLQLRRQAFTALRVLLQRLAARQPLLLCIDDLQWGDLDSAALLAAVLRPPDPPPLLLVLSFRSEERAVSPVLRAMLTQEPEASPFTAATVHRIDLKPLPEAEARVLAAVLAGGESAVTSQADSIVREAAGSPIFLGELVRHVRHNRASNGSADRALGQAISVGQVVRDRVGRLTSAARDLLEVVAVNGQPLEEPLACAAAGLSGASALESIASLCAAGLLRSTARGQLETYHDRIWETVVAELPPGRLGARHLALARALESAPRPDADLLALHWQGAGEPAKAAEYAVRAADRAFEALAFERAARLYQLALQLGAARGAGRRALQVRLADALANAGRGADAAQTYLAATEGAERVEALQLRQRAVAELVLCGHMTESLGILRGLLDEAGFSLPRSRRQTNLMFVKGRLRLALRGLRYKERSEDQVPAEQLERLDTCIHACYALSVQDPAIGAAFHTQHLLLALKAGEPHRIALALARELTIQAGRGEGARRKVERTLRVARTLIERLEDPLLMGHLQLGLASAAMMMGQWTRSLAAAARAEAIYRAHCPRNTWQLDTVHTIAFTALMLLGRLGELSRRQPPLIKEADERGSFYARASFRVWSYLGLLAADQPEQSRCALATGQQSLEGAEFYLQRLLNLLGGASIDLYQGDPLSAWQRLEQGWPVLDRSYMLLLQTSRVLANWHRAAAALASARHLGAETGDGRRLLRAAGVSTRRVARTRAEWARPVALTLQAGLAATKGHTRRALDLLGAAEPLADGVDMSLLSSIIRRRRGELLGGDTGIALISSADLAMGAQGIVNPARLSEIYAPGFSKP